MAKKSKNIISEQSEKLDFDNLDYTQIVWGMKSSFGFNKTALYSLLLGSAGAYVGYNLKDYLNGKDLK